MNTAPLRRVTLAIALAVLGSLVSTAAADPPIRADDYQNMLGMGLATSTFKNSRMDFDVQHVRDFRARGFTNVRLRTAANLWNTDAELDYLRGAVEQCLAEDVSPILSWIDHEAEERASNADRDEFVAWWRDVAQKMDGVSHRLAFNLFTEIGRSPLRTDLDRYNDWTRRAVNAIRSVSPTRMIILSAPAKNSPSLEDIASGIYRDDRYMMAEWHLYASGPNQRGGQKNWEGNGSRDDRENVTSIIDAALDFTATSGIPTWFGAWMPMDNKAGSLTQNEVENFARFFLEELFFAGIPCTANAVAQYYDKSDDSWLTTKTVGDRTLRMDDIVDIFVNTGGNTGAVVFADTFDSDIDGWARTRAVRTTSSHRTFEGRGAAQLEESGKMQINVSTVGFSRLEIEVALRTDGFDNGEVLKVQWRPVRSVSWRTVRSFTSPRDETYSVITVPLPSEADNQSGFQFRFKSNSSASWERSYVDSVVIRGND